MDCSSEELPAVKKELDLLEDEDGAPIFDAKEVNEKATITGDGGGMVKVGVFGNIRKLMHGLSSRDDSFLDLDLICAENKVLRCHKFIIGAQSTYLRQLMLSVENGGGSGEDGNRCRMNFPDVEVEHMEVILKFLYTG